MPQTKIFYTACPSIDDVNESIGDDSITTSLEIAKEWQKDIENSKLFKITIEEL